MGSEPPLSFSSAGSQEFIWQLIVPRNLHILFLPFLAIHLGGHFIFSTSTFYFLLSHICFPFHQRCWHLRVHLAAPRRGPPLSQLGLSLPHSSLTFPQNSFGRMGVMGAGETVFSLLKVFSSALSLICSLMENKVPFGRNFIISSKSSLLWLLVYHSENTKKQWSENPSIPSTYSTTVLHPFFLRVIMFFEEFVF